MAFQPVGNGAETVIKGKLDGEDAFVTQGWLGVVGYTQSELDQLAFNVEEWWLNQMLPLLPFTYVYLETIANDLRSQTGFTADSAVGAGDNGGTGGQAEPNNVSFVIKFGTGLRGRTQRGRNYMPGVPKNLVLSNEVDEVWANACVTAYSTLLNSNGFSPDWIWSVISRSINKVKRPVAVAQEIKEVGYTDLYLDSQRRRGKTRGQ